MRRGIRLPDSEGTTLAAGGFAAPAERENVIVAAVVRSIDPLPSRS